MDSEFRIDISEVQRSIDFAEVVALYFPLLRKTLLLDTRTNHVDGPMIKVVPMASSPEERFRELVLPWPKYVSSLVRLEVWDHIVRRYLELGSPEIVRQCESCLNELRGMEREEFARAITGENYETLWDADGAHEEAASGADDDDEDGA
jgi:hypothetical protein